MLHANDDLPEITSESLAGALRKLGSHSATARHILNTYGPPPEWRREPGFSSLVYTILEQQVSLASARAVYERLLDLVGELTPARFLEFGPAELRAIGFSRQKTDYCTNLARMIVGGELDLVGLSTASDETVRERLTTIRGIGQWTADIYLLHSLGRPDVWPTGDLALRVAVQEELGLPEQPGRDELISIGEEFRPWRSVAARLFWHGYLVRRGVRTVT